MENLCPCPRRRGKSLFFALLLALAVCWISADGLLHMSTSLTPAITVTVPHLVGRRFDDKLITADPYFVPSVTYVYHPDVPPRTVISQYPPPNAQKKLGFRSSPCPLALVVSMGRHEVKIPDVVGQSAQEAKLALESLGLTVVSSPVTLWGSAAETAAVDGVTDVYPTPGTSVLWNSEVKIFVARPNRPPSAVCPNTVGMTLSDASAALKNAGFEVSYNYEKSLFYRHFPITRHHTVRVLQQDSIPGTRLPHNTVITLTVGAHTPSPLS